MNVFYGRENLFNIPYNFISYLNYLFYDNYLLYYIKIYINISKIDFKVTTMDIKL